MTRLAPNNLTASFTTAQSASSGTEKRQVPRVHTNFEGELASGTVVVPMVVHDLSVMGCGVEIRGGDVTLPDKVGEGGVLHFPASETGSPDTILPVVLRNVRSDGLHLMYGLEFQPLSPNQEHKLHDVIEVMAEESP